MSNKESGVRGLIGSMFTSDYTFPSTDRELMDIGTISALVRDGHVPHPIANLEQEHTFAVGQNEITLTENQARLVTDAVNVELYRERDKELLAKFGL